MYFKQFYDTDLAQGSYLIGCQATGDAIVVDPRRDVGVYLAEAAANGLRVTAVTDTHIHADYLSGARELATATGAALYLSNEGGAEWQYGFDHQPLLHGDVIQVGKVRFDVLHTPGHAGGLICLYEPAGRTLLSSDHLLAGISSNPVVEPPPPGRDERLLSLDDGLPAEGVTLLAGMYAGPQLEHLAPPLRIAIPAPQ